MAMFLGSLTVLVVVSYSVFYKLSHRYENLIPAMFITGFGVLALIWAFVEWGIGTVLSLEVEMKLTGMILIYTVLWPVVCKRVVERMVENEEGQEDPSFYFEQELG